MKNVFLSLSLLLAGSAYSKDTKPVYLSQKKIVSGGHILVEADKSVSKMKMGSVYVTVTNDCHCSLESFNASMPKHKHGMFVKPSAPKLISSGSKGRTYKIDGVKLHMPGLWLLDLKIKKKSEEIDLQVPYQMNL